MAQDFSGNAFTFVNDAAQGHWNALVQAFLAHGAQTPVHLGALLEADPDAVMGHVAKGMFMTLLGRRELLEVAREALATAEAIARNHAVTASERLYVEALRACLAGNPGQGITALERILQHTPTDALAMKLSHAWRFVLGDAQGMRRALERLAPAFGPDHAAHGYFLGCQAFAFEETGDYAAAETAGRAGLEHSADDAWGLHAVAHVHDMTANATAGLKWLTGREAAWAHCNNFRYHVWWHKALMHLDLGQISAALALYDAEIRADKTDDYRDISNATSLLSRLELEGVDVGNRWEELADISEKRTEDGCLIFADLHYLLALAGGGRAAAMDRLVARIGADGARADSDVGNRMASPGHATAQGLEAFGEGNYAAAFENLRNARPHMHLAGGSHAQRDVFERLTIDAGLRAGRAKDVALILDDRQARRGGHEDGYAAVRRDMIARMGRAACDAGFAAE